LPKDVTEIIGKAKGEPYNIKIEAEPTVEGGGRRKSRKNLRRVSRLRNRTRSSRKYRSRRRGLKIKSRRN